MLKNDRKIRNKMIREEKKIKKYLIKNDFDVMKGFLEFFKVPLTPKFFLHYYKM